jgi:hypothetical protein
MAETMADWVDQLFAESPPVATKVDKDTGVILEMRGKTGSSDITAFDSYLIPHHGPQNHTLTLVLKICLRQKLPQGMDKAVRIVMPEGGPNPRYFLIKPWQSAEWTNFLKGFKHECAKWSNQFWLIPPADFSKLDIPAGQKAIRPNIYCHLDVVVVGDPASAHQSVDVVNIDSKDAKSRLGLTDEDLNGGRGFRSSNRQYARDDPKTHPNARQDLQGKWHTVKNYSTIVHEIGHALGLPHIGVTIRDPLCQLAVLAEKTPATAGSMPAIFKGGVNADVCYGSPDFPKRWQNVMGGGSTFEESNAAPWARRLALHTGTKPQDWTASTKKVSPKLLIAPAPRPLQYKVRLDSVNIGN